MVRKTKAQAEETREHLLDAAEEAFYELGVAKTSLEEIARRAGVTRGAIYWHFRNKMDLFNAMLDRVQLPLAELLNELSDGRDPIMALRELCIYSLSKLSRNSHHRRVYTILFHRCEFTEEANPTALRQTEQVAESVRILEGYFICANRMGLLNARFTPRSAAYALHAYMVGLYSDWLRDPDRFDIAEKAPVLLDALLLGIAATTNPVPAKINP